jgi:hypothetical protein
MEGPTERTVRQLLREKAPELYNRLAQDGNLEHFIYYRAAAVTNRVSSLRTRENWDYLPHLDLVRNLNTARAEATEAVLADILQAETAH